MRYAIIARALGRRQNITQDTGKYRLDPSIFFFSLFFITPIQLPSRRTCLCISTWKESAESEGYKSRVSECEGRRETEMVDVHHLGAEKSGATEPGQRRVFGYATIWGAKLEAAAMQRVNGDHGRTAEQGEGVGRRPSNVHCVEERLAGTANEEKRGRLPKGAPRATFQKNASFQTCLACVNVGP